LNGKLYDANGHEFMIRGVDRCHYDSGSLPAMSYSKANAVRTFVGINYGQTWSGLANIIQTQNIAYDEVPVIAAPSTTTGTGTSCSSDPTVLSDVVANSWVASASTWTAFNKNSIYNIANEWGPSNSTVWRDSYVTAISQMRGAGYLGPLMIDAGGCGQDEADLAQYAAAVFMSDPQRNVIFSYHMYGGTNDESAAIRAVLTGMERGIRNG
jgi:mannan endo-1,4-beta-mannosidase